MSESAVEEKMMQSEEQEPVQTQTTAGALLRQAREAARMQLPVMAAMLKVPQHKLQALESDDYDSFPDHVFMRALAMSMCRTLHIEAEPVLALLPHREIKSLSSTGTGINEAVKVRSNFKGAGTPLDSGSNSTRKIIVGVLVLLAAAAAVYFVPFHQTADNAGESAVPVAVHEQAGDAVQESALVAQPAAQVTESVETPLGSAAAVNAPATDSVPTAPAEGAASVASSGAAVAASDSGAQAATAATDAAASASATAGLLVLKVNTGQSWVKVKDGAGKVVLEKTLNKDETATAEGQLPLSVIVGNAKGTQVTVRGEPLDISNTRDNVARFEVK